MRLNLEEMEDRPTNTIDGFYDRLEKLMPSLYSHRCSPGVEGGFFQRVIAGTWMGHVIGAYRARDTISCGHGDRLWPHPRNQDKGRL